MGWWERAREVLWAADHVWWCESPELERASAALRAALYPPALELFLFEEVDPFFLPLDDPEPNAELVLQATQHVEPLLAALPPRPAPAVPERTPPPPPPAAPPRMGGHSPRRPPQRPPTAGSPIPRRPRPGGRSGGAALSPN